MNWKKLARSLLEAPMSDFSLGGEQDKDGSLSSSDMATARDKAFVERLNRFYSRSPVNVTFHIHNATDGNYHGRDVREPNAAMTYSGRIMAEEFTRLAGVSPAPDAINMVILTAEQKLTPTGIGRQLVQAVLRADHNMFSVHADVLFKEYHLFIDNMITLLASSGVKHADSFRATDRLSKMNFVGQYIGTTPKSRNHGYDTPTDWLVDLIAEWMQSGQISFMNSRLSPDVVKALPGFEQRLAAAISDFLRPSVGKCYIL